MRRLYVVVCAALVLLGSPARAGEVADRLATGMEAWKRAGAAGRWWSCGVAQEDGAGIARELGALIEAEAAAQGVNPWGLAGTIAKESRFDECAIGKKTRDWAYRSGIMRPNRLTISHTKADVLAVLGDARWRREVGRTDLGIPQVMYPTVYRGDPAALLERPAGVREAALEMAGRARRIGAVMAIALLRPWGTWPGWYDADYDRSVVAYARKLGATPDDLADLPASVRSRAPRHVTVVR